MRVEDGSGSLIRKQGLHEKLLQGVKDGVQGVADGVQEVNAQVQDGSLQDKLLHRGFVKSTRSAVTIELRDSIFLNRCIVLSWPFFSLYLLSQPWLSNWVNNTWWNYSADYTVVEQNGTVLSSTRPGMCDTPAQYIQCTDGQDFAELALKARGKAIGCGCGQGFLGEGLCPMTSYGFTLSDYVSTEPGIALMLGLGFFPLLGTWRNTMLINMLAKPSKTIERFHMHSMALFQVSYILWGVASCCIFPTAHSILTVAFLGSFLLHWVITALICVACMGIANIESVVTIGVSASAIGVITLGAIPRILLTLNEVLGISWFWNLNYGYGSYAFWAGEAVGLTLTFGAYPIILIAVHIFPHWSDLNHDGHVDEQEKMVFALIYQNEALSEEPSAPVAVQA